MGLIRVDDLNAATPLSALTAPVTPNDQYYLRSHAEPPAIDIEAWRLVVKGGTERQLALSELRALPADSVIVTMECAGNGRSGMSPQPPGTPWGLGAASVAEFTGVPLARVLESVGLDEDIVEVLFTGADSSEAPSGQVETYRRSLPVAAALDPGVLIAWEMGGELLAPAHGAPARLVVPGWYGMASVKWLTEIEAIREPFRGYYQSDRYVYDGEDGIPDGTPVTTARVRSLITAPTEGDSVAGEVEITGIAWSGDGAITAVEVSVDGGDDWQVATLHTPSAPHGPTFWALPWVQARGSYELVARATDVAGNVQPLEAVWNEHGYGNNAVHRVNVHGRA